MQHGYGQKRNDLKKSENFDKRSMSQMNATTGTGITMHLNDMRRKSDFDFAIEGTEKIRNNRSR